MLFAAEIPVMESLNDNPWPKEFTARFKFIRCLGNGGLSSVFLVEDKKSPGFQMALKILNAKELDNDNLERFRKEFEVLTSIQHPNLIETFELVESGNAIAYLMEYVEGKNLLEYLRAGKLKHEEIDQIFSQLLAALFELHKNGLAHRDIKLENLLVRSDGFVKLSDLGLMKKAGGIQATEAGILLGTSQYLPPEYVKHSIYDFRSDIYATGLMLFECLVGKRWLNGKKGAKAIRYLVEMNFEFPKLALAGLPLKYQRILQTALAVQPWKRFKDADAMRLSILSEHGDDNASRTVEVSENISIRAVHERRKTQEFISIQARRQKWIYSGAGIIGAALILCIIGISLKENPKQAPAVVQAETSAPTAKAEIAKAEPIQPPDSKVTEKNAKLVTIAKVKTKNVSTKSP